MVYKYNTDDITFSRNSLAKQVEFILYEDYAKLENLQQATDMHNDRLEAENAILRKGMKGDYDLDRWLDWVTEVKKLEAESNKWLRLAQQFERENESLKALFEDQVHTDEGKMEELLDNVTRYRSALEIIKNGTSGHTDYYIAERALENNS
ncbi:hypothetical protein KA005_32015 [bacterium]|nr:hypothetical protein [bacterium]